MSAHPRRRGPALPIRTRRLLLREFEPGDEAGVAAWSCDRRVTRHLLHGPRTELGAKRHLAALLHARRERPRRRWDLAVTLADGGALIGACDLALTAPGEATIGYLLVPRHWGLGYGTEVAAALVRLAFESLGVERVISLVAVANERSANVLTRAGLAWDATLRGYGRIRNRRFDADRYVLERRCWRKAGPAGCP